MLANTHLPRPTIPLAPVLSLDSLRRGAGPRAATVLDAGEVRLVTSGRVALALALREIGVGPGDEVLLPAYHSGSMVPPVLWREALPVFYRVAPDAQADLADLAARIGPRTRVVVATHFFGFAQPMAALRSLCDAHGLALLEDCAHAFIGEHDGRPLGAWGDYAAASTMKFLPVYEGGALVSARHALDGVALRSAGAAFEIKAVLNTLERGFGYGRLGALRAALWLPLRAKEGLWNALKRGRPATPRLAPGSSDSSLDLDPRWTDKRASLTSRAILRWSSPTRIAQRRRANYLGLQEAIADLPRVRTLHRELPQGTCPWLFPLLADDPDALVQRLAREGVPLTRFGHPLASGVGPSTCANAARLARHVLGLPCHQELREDELRWLVDAVRRAVRA